TNRARRRWFTACSREWRSCTIAQEHKTPSLLIANTEDNATMANVLLNPPPTFGQAGGPGRTAAAGWQARWRTRRRPRRSYGSGILDQGVGAIGRNVQRDQH